MIIGTLTLALQCAVISTILEHWVQLALLFEKGDERFVSTQSDPVVNADVVTGFSICVLMIVVFGVNKDSFIPLITGMLFWLHLLSIFPLCQSSSKWTTIFMKQP